ncbi:ATP-dependent DNA ligase [Microbacterium rhizosphaerae]|uniref:ATP-dependent DNA ligase n=1 Tax=Microbacterium rhizosphaerae TaxID=1678237 RepID=UPI0032185E16
MDGVIPASIRFPPEVVLARAADAIPAETALPGGCRFEPKWDGFRVTIVCDAVTSMWSRRGTDLTGIFPEIVAAARDQLPLQSIFDGELVIWRDERLAFDALLKRLSSGARRARSLARELPAHLVLFDVLALDGLDARRLRFDDRRELLVETLDAAAPPILLSPMTTDRAEAEAWSADMAAAGIEGLVVKGGAQPYRPGERLWVKVKRRETVDVVLGAVIGTIREPASIVVGAVLDGRLRVTGQSAPLNHGQAHTLGSLLAPPSRPHPWPTQLSQAALGRFRAGGDPTIMTLVEPVIAEVSADAARTAEAFRHTVRFQRLRPDLPVPDFTRE